LNFNIFTEKTLCPDKTSLAFAYKVGYFFLYETVSARKATSDFNDQKLFAIILDSQNSKEKI
jgi:hypothetical protein